VVLRQSTSIPDGQVTRLSVVSGSATFTLRIRVPGWVAGQPAVELNGTVVRGPVSGWIVLSRCWRPGDQVTVTFPMALDVPSAPDDPTVRAVTYGPVVLAGTVPVGTAPAAVAGAVPADANPLGVTPALPALDPASIQRETGAALGFTARSAGQTVPLVPVSRTGHDYYTVYWRTPT
jgi:hypothetical protein